jgi:hypothetical protein
MVALTATKGANEMIGRRAIVGASLLCAIAFCAFAQSAAAVPAKNTTAFTCVEGGGAKDFADAHCDKKVPAGQGKFGHVAIALNQTTEITVTNAKTKNETVGPTFTVFKFTFLGIPTEVSCKNVHGTGTLHNVEPIAKEHKVTGTLTIKVTECKVVAPEKCAVKQPIEFKTEFEGVEELGPEKNTHGIEFRPHKEGPVALMELFFEGPECVFNEKVVPINGTMVATGQPSPKERHSGATLFFTGEMTKETLKVEGKPAEHLGALTMRMAPIGGVEQNPISFTTHTPIE